MEPDQILSQRVSRLQLRPAVHVVELVTEGCFPVGVYKRKDGAIPANEMRSYLLECQGGRRTSSKRKRQLTGEDEPVPPRPRNMFVIARSLLQKLIVRRLGLNPKEVSKIMGDIWKRYSVKSFVQYFEYLAKIESLRHEYRFPKYTFTPKGSKMTDVSKFSNFLEGMPVESFVSATALPYVLRWNRNVSDYMAKQHDYEQMKKERAELKKLIGKKKKFKLSFSDLPDLNATRSSQPSTTSPLQPLTPDSLTKNTPASVVEWEERCLSESGSETQGTTAVAQATADIEQDSAAIAPSPEVYEDIFNSWMFYESDTEAQATAVVAQAAVGIKKAAVVIAPSPQVHEDVFDSWMFYDM